MRRQLTRWSLTTALLLLPACTAGSREPAQAAVERQASDTLAVAGWPEELCVRLAYVDRPDIAPPPIFVHLTPTTQSPVVKLGAYRSLDLQAFVKPLPSPDSGFDITVAKAPPVFTYFSLTARRRPGGAWEGSAGTYIDAGDVYSGFRLQGKTVSCSPPEAAPSAPARRPN